MSGTIAALVVSYNRSRMLAEALATVAEADQVVLADDGSDFDVRALARQFKLPDPTLVLNPPKSPERRWAEPSCGALLNRALGLVKTDYVTYLCDDDLFAPGWINGARAALDYYRRFHMICGQWSWFNDGQPLSEAEPCKYGFTLPLTTGNFAHRMSCFRKEGCRWAETSLAVHDAHFLGDYMQRHGYAKRGARPWLGKLDLFAGYRREHPKTVTHHACGNDTYQKSAEVLFREGSME